MTSNMKKYSWYFILFACLVFLAISIISWDYAYGHKGDNQLLANKCPLCAAFNFFKLKCTFIASLLALYILLFNGFLSFKPCFMLSNNHNSIFSPRAPPVFC
jgi:hypothetical protein